MYKASTRLPCITSRKVWTCSSVNVVVFVRFRRGFRTKSATLRWTKPSRVASLSAECKTVWILATDEADKPESNFLV